MVQHFTFSGAQPVTQVVLSQPSEGSIIPDGTTGASEPELSANGLMNEPASLTPAATERACSASLVPFAAGQVYYRSLATQVRVLPESDITVLDVAVQ